MKNHPGHFWICLWLIVLIMAVGGVETAVNKLTSSIERVALTLSRR